MTGPSGNPFSRPFPPRAFGRTVVFGHARTAAFVLLALLFLFPLPVALAYGLLVFLVAVAYTYLTQLGGVKRSGGGWTLWRWAVDQTILLFLVSTACFLLHNALNDWRLMSWRVLLYITVPTVLVGLLPIVASGMAVQYKAERERELP